MSNAQIDPMIDEIRQLLAERLGAKGSALAQQFDRARRSIPRRLRYDAQVLIHAAVLKDHPKMASQIDMQALRRSHKAMRKFLSEVDARDRFIGHFLGTLATIAAGLIVVTVGVVSILVWRGLL